MTTQAEKRKMLPSLYNRIWPAEVKPDFTVSQKCKNIRRFFETQ
jgi:hypothetical protein